MSDKMRKARRKKVMDAVLHHCKCSQEQNEAAGIVATGKGKPDCAPLGLLEDVERALTKINEAEGYFLLGKIASGKNMLGDGKSILEKVVERWPTSSNDRHWQEQ